MIQIKNKKIYMIGIKGVGMTMLAQYLKNKCALVSGSDISEKFMTDKILKDSDIKIIEKFDSANIPSDADLIIYSTAYNEENNVEVKEIFSKKNFNYKSKILTYAQALGEIFNETYGIAVVGSHGKTTTTAWLGYVLEKSGYSPSVMVGSNVPQFKGANLTGSSDYLIIEADEYQNKLQYFNPKAVLLNNIDFDHPDFFPTPEEYEQTFLEFIKKIPKKGFLVANFDDLIVKKISPYCKGKLISYAINNTADYIAFNIRHENSKQYFKVKIGAINDFFETDEFTNTNLGDFSISLLGHHNVLNALAVICACVEVGIPLFKIRKHLEEFQGTTRRMEILGKYKGALIIDDYAHHPTEIKASLSAARQLYPQEKIIVAFHPHTFTRTKALLDNFSQSFDAADEIIILDIYGSAREKQGGVHSLDLIEGIKKHFKTTNSKDKKIIYTRSLKECENYLAKNLNRNEICILMGAGDIFKIGHNLVNHHTLNTGH